MQKCDFLKIKKCNPLRNCTFLFNRKYDYMFIKALVVAADTAAAAAAIIA